MNSAPLWRMPRRLRLLLTWRRRRAPLLVAIQLWPELATLRHRPWWWFKWWRRPDGVLRGYYQCADSMCVLVDIASPARVRARLMVLGGTVWESCGSAVEVLAEVERWMRPRRACTTCGGTGTTVWEDWQGYRHVARCDCRRGR
jgi:hypothetical protein